MTEPKKKGGYPTGRPRSIETRQKIAETLRGSKQTPTHIQRRTEKRKGFKHSDESRENMSQSKMGEKNPRGFAGRTHTEEAKVKIGAVHIGKTLTEETKAKMSAARTELYQDPKNHPRWNGGISFEPYCSRFNLQLKEKIRNRDNRICILCGKGEIQNGQRLSVHHIDTDKMQGCNGKKWHLCALCKSCNSKPDTVEKEFLIVTNTAPTS